MLAREVLAANGTQSRYFGGGTLNSDRVYKMVNSPARVSAAWGVLDTETRELIAWQQAHPEKMQIEFVADVERSKALNEQREGAVIISASGMCEAGRIKFHLRANLPRRESTILITGFQAAGTFGRRLVDGAKRVRLLGEDIPVRADLYTLGGLSAHADRSEILRWLGDGPQIGSVKLPMIVGLSSGEGK